MQLARSHLTMAVSQGIITNDQADLLWQLVEQQNKNVPSFQIVHSLYYLGGLLAIGAMWFVMILGEAKFGGFGLVAICMVYVVIGVTLTELLLVKYKLVIPAGILAALVVVVVPVVIYGLLTGFGLADPQMDYLNFHLDLNRLLMELVTLVVGFFMLARYKLPFLMLPIAVSLWFMNADLIHSLLELFNHLGITHLHDSLYWYGLSSEALYLWSGLLMIIVAFIVDYQNTSGKDFAFWLYLVGVTAFWGGISMVIPHNDSELSNVIYGGINLLMILLGATFERRVFTVFGGIGIAGYLSYLSYEVFKNSLLFPIVVTMIGLLIILLGIVWQYHEKAINQYLQQFLPKQLRGVIERRHN